MQLALDISLNPDVSFDNFCWQGNEFLKASLFDAKEIGEQFIYLWGAKGSGKSHILQAYTAMFESPGCYLPLSDIKTYGTEALEGLSELDLVCLDDIDEIAGNRAFEEQLFHLYNQVRDSGKMLLISGEHAPLHSPIQLPDLRSRLAWGLVYQIKSLSEEATLELLQMRAKEKGLRLAPQVAQYLLTHTHRDLSALMQVLERLDKASLLQKRKITIPLVKEVLTKSAMVF